MRLLPGVLTSFLLLSCGGNSLLGVRASPKEFHRNLQDTTTSISVVIKTDAAPEEIGWTLFDSVSGLLVRQVDFGTYQVANSTVTTTLQVTKNRSYTLQLRDSASNGICCDGNVVVYFGDSAAIDSILAALSGTYTDQAFLTFDASSEGIIVIEPSVAPTGAPSDTLSPSVMASNTPTASPAPTTTFAPTETIVTVVLTFAILTDGYPDEIAWQLRDDKGIVVEEAPLETYTRGRALELHTVFVTQGASYSLILFDSASDGLCCFYGSGEVRVYLGFPDSSPLAYSDGVYGSRTVLEFEASIDAVIPVPPPAPTPVPSSPSPAPSSVPFSPSFSPFFFPPGLPLIPTAPSFPFPFSSPSQPFAPVPVAPISPFANALDFIGGDSCTSGSPCGICQGDCDYDSDCVGDLVCYQRNSGEPIPPECAYAGDFRLQNWDFCAKRGSPGYPNSSPVTSPTFSIPTIQYPSCSICGAGFIVGNSDALVYFPGQPAVPCGVLEDAGNTNQIPPDSCPFFQDLVFSTCECQSASPNPPSPRFPSYPASTPLLPTERPPIFPPERCVDPGRPGACSICGEGFCVGSPDAIFEFPGMSPISCGNLEVAGATGYIPLDQCPFLPTLVAIPCSCQTAINPGPTHQVTPTLSPIAPFTVSAPVLSPPIAAFPVFAPVPPSFNFPPADSVLTYLGEDACSPSSPCGLCQGDCDTDKDCRPGLECYHRTRPSDPIPSECTHLENFNPELWDFCVPTCFVPSGLCSVCGEGQCVTQPDQFFFFPGQGPIACGLLEAFCEENSGCLEICPLLPDLLDEVCGCQPGFAWNHANAPVVAPIFLPPTIAPFAPSSRTQVVSPTTFLTTPPSTSILEYLESHPDKFSTLVSLATSAGVKLALHNDVGPFTLFAPTNAAWETVNYSSLDRPSLQQLLFHHLLRRQLALENGSGTGQYRTTTIELTTAAVTYDSSSGYAVNGVAIVQPINVLQTNGIVHTVDQVLVPPGFTFPAQ